MPAIEQTDAPTQRLEQTGAPTQNIDMLRNQEMDTETEERKKRFLKTVLTSLSNGSAAYNIANINLAHVILENEYCGGDNCKSQVTIASTACLVGAITGQLTFGYVGDCLGRGRALQLTTIFTIFGALISAFVFPPDSHNQQSAFTVLIVMRFILGIGVGGVYPLAATIAAESSNNANRGRSVSLVFSMQGIGQLFVPIMGMVFCYSFGDFAQREDRDNKMPGLSWRFILGIGALPGFIIMLLNRSLLADREASPRNNNRDPAALTLRQALTSRTYWPKIIGCAGGWFLFDITFYGNTLFAPTVLKSVFHTNEITPVIGPQLKDNLCWQLFILTLIGLPGYYIAVFFMDRCGRKIIQLQGFFFMAVLYAVLGAFLKKLQHDAVPLLIIYGLTYFFSNFGPNSTTFILPSETFPVEVRSSLNGFCAACGKVGAALGSACFKPLVHLVGTPVVFYICAACAALGLLLTAVFVEDRRGRDMAIGHESLNCEGS